jgi:DNA polymerase I-like protein with 3'-5' exonuclease and polymerase domains
MREPGKVRAVEAHFALLLRYLKGEFIPNELKIVPEVLGDLPDKIPAEVGCDIETYGILAGVEQTVFHPIKSKEIDGIPFKDQVVTVSFSWYEDGKRIRTPLYMFRYKAHRKKIREWFRFMSKHKIVCVGQNIKFDLLYLYFCGDPELRYWIDPRRLLVDDTLITGFLLYEQQPEKGLKEQAILFGVTDYSKMPITGKGGNAKSCHDKNLHYYNCKDSATTLELRKVHLQLIGDKFGKDSPKLSDVCKWLRNAIIWDVFDLEKNGSAFNIDKLEAYHEEEQTRCKELLESMEEKYKIKLAGTGSDAPLRQLMLDCLAEADLMRDSRVTWTAKEKKISIGVENVNLVREHLPAGRSFEIISAFQEFKERSKIVSTYTRPILQDARKGIVIRNRRVGIVFPSWYPVPLYANRGGSSDDKAGGQIQGRFSCKKPARQTEPRSIRDCSRSRWPGGSLVECDMSQDHLRMAALLSGDPVLMEAYEKEGESDLS